MTDPTSCTILPWCKQWKQLSVNDYIRPLSTLHMKTFSVVETQWAKVVTPHYATSWMCLSHVFINIWLSNNINFGAKLDITKIQRDVQSRRNELLLPFFVFGDMLRWSAGSFVLCYICEKSCWCSKAALYMYYWSVLLLFIHKDSEYKTSSLRIVSLCYLNLERKKKKFYLLLFTFLELGGPPLAPPGLGCLWDRLCHLRGRGSHQCPGLCPLRLWWSQQSETQWQQVSGLCLNRLKR